MSSDLSSRRCLRHPEREAAARCTACRRLFCRECVADHGGRMVCAECLAAALRRAPAAPPRRWVGVRRALARAGILGVGLIAAWVYFFVLGQVLHSLPAAAHDFAPWLQEDLPENEP